MSTGCRAPVLCTALCVYVPAMISGVVEATQTRADCRQPSKQLYTVHTQYRWSLLLQHSREKTDICIASKELTAEALRCGSHSFHTANTPHLPLLI